MTSLEKRKHKLNRGGVGVVVGGGGGFSQRMRIRKKKKKTRKETRTFSTTLTRVNKKKKRCVESAERMITGAAFVGGTRRDAKKRFNILSGGCRETVACEKGRRFRLLSCRTTLL